MGNPYHVLQGGSTMIIAVPTGEGIVEEYVESCKTFMLYKLSSDYSIETVETFENIATGDNGIPAIAAMANELAKRGVSHLIVMRIGIDTIHMFHARNICIVRGAIGKVDEIVNAFIHGDLDDNPLPNTNGNKDNYAKAV